LPFAATLSAASLRQARGARVAAALVLSCLASMACQREPGRGESGELAGPAAASEATWRASRSELALAALRQVNPREQPPSACPDDMVLVEGNYCPLVELDCKRYLDPKGRYEQFRCAEYGPSKCLSKERQAMRFCIDRTEFTESGQTLPANHRSFTHGEKACGALGKRLCRESEWNFACEGEEMRPYPYGFARDSGACNADRVDVLSPAGKLRDLRAPSGSFARCQSPFGVMDMAGNLEEFVAMDGRGAPQPAMKGAYWQPSRNFCRAAQTAHDRYYNGTETGFRCCADVPEPDAAR
jgi:formylglycine-generating enzyme